MKIGGLQKLTLLDYPNTMACTVFTLGCNFCCPFCQNGDLVNQEVQPIPQEEIFAFLRKRKNVLAGVCVTGGEPLLQPDLEDFLRQVKDIGYLVKLDTNGYMPQKLQHLLSLGLVDYVAMDVKNSMARYPQTAGANVDLQKIRQSVDLLKSGAIAYEFRTTVTGNLHDKQSIADMANWLVGAQKWYLQPFQMSDGVIDKSTTPCSSEMLHKYLAVAREKIPHTFLRGVEE